MRKYHIVGTEEFGYSTVNRYLYSFYRYKNTVKRVCELYPYVSVHDLRGYVAHFCYRRLKSFDTLIKVVLDHKDYLAACCILRMLGDSVAVFHLIYMEKDRDLRWLRHALYVIDGCEENIKVLSDGEINRGAIPDEELEMHKKGLRYNKELRQRLKAEAQLILDKSPLLNKDKEAFDKIVEDRNWKFKEFKVYKHISKNKYEWKDLYKKIGRCENIDILSFISQYAHGLSMSNLVMEMNEENRDGILNEAQALLERLNREALNFFAPEQLYVVHGLLEPDMSKEILSCFDDEHRPSIEEWNEMVKNIINQMNNES